MPTTPSTARRSGRPPTSASSAEPRRPDTGETPVPHHTGETRLDQARRGPVPHHTGETPVPHRRSTPLPRRPGFSLLELMIAIVIFGIGMVMVATVFPVGLDLTRETVQLDLSQAATDAAMATLVLRVPSMTELETTVDKAALVAVADVAQTDLDANMDTAQASAVATPPAPMGRGEWAAVGWQTVDPVLFANRYLRAFTEETGWAAELMGNNNDTAVVPGQNLPSGYGQLDSYKSGDLDAFLHDGALTMIPPSFGVRSAMPRIHLADQVYPPVSPYMYLADADNTQPGTGFAGTDERPLAEVVEDLASRRYSWTALHCMTSPDTQNRRIRAAIVVTYRGDLTARYAAQADEDPDAAGNEPNVYVPHFNLTDDDDRKNLFLPQPVPNNEVTNGNPWNKDALFPRPWLVMLRRIDRAGGEVLCSNEVACLLPTGSFFVIASRAGEFSPLESFKVLKSSFCPDDKSTGRERDGSLHKWDDWAGDILQTKTDNSQWATLQIARGQGQPAENVLAWVFPPAIERTGTAYRFQPRSPVISVAQREVPAR